MTDSADGQATREDLRAAFEHEVTTDKRAAAETAYALAFRYRNEDVDGTRRFDVAKKWATRAIELLSELPSDTLDQVASTRASVGGVDLPSMLHADIVRERLADVLI
jgi:hypothetical protein